MVLRARTGVDRLVSSIGDGDIEGKFDRAFKGRIYF